jgi:hypothetical protein
VDTRVIGQIILSLAGVRKFHIEILHSSSWTIHWKRWRKSVDTNSTQQSLICLGPWWWPSQNIAYELRVVGREKFLVKGGQSVCSKMFWHDLTKAQLQKFWGWNSYAELGPETEMKVK